MSQLRWEVPEGKFRVITVDLFSHEEYSKDFDTKDEAVKTADEVNSKRKGSMDDVAYVYNDKGQLIQGDNVSKGKDGNRVGISP